MFFASTVLLEIRVILHGSLTRKMIQVNDTHLLDPGERYHNVLPESGVSLFLIFVFFKYLSLMAMVVLNHFACTVPPLLYYKFMCTSEDVYNIHSLFLYLVWQAGYSLIRRDTFTSSAWD